MSVKPILKKLTHASEKSSLDLHHPDLYGLGLNVQDYNGTGTRSSLSDGLGNTRHYRSASTETTASSKKFVHPFAQSPRPYTPPLRENEIASENVGINEEDLFPPRSTSNLSSHRIQINNPPGGPAPLRIQTSRRAYAVYSGSQSNLHSPLAPDHLSTSATMSPSSVRSSFDRAIPRIRSRSDLSTISHADAVRQARRQFNEKQATKDRKHAQEEIRAMEKQTAREERKLGRKSATMSESAGPKRSRNDLINSQNEKIGGLVGTDYNTTSRRAPPVHANSSGSESYNQSRRRSDRSAKKKTHSLWTEFVLWLRTRLFKIGRKASRH